MRSIYSRLLLILLPGFAIFWMAGAITVYFSVSDSLHSAIDSELPQQTRYVRASLGDGRRPAAGGLPDRRWLDAVGTFSDTGSGSYFQIWDPDGALVKKSQSLGAAEFERPIAATETPQLSNVELSNGERVRALVARLRIRNRDEDDAELQFIDVVIAKSREPVLATMRQWVIWLSLASLCTFTAAAFLTRWALRSGLRPIAQLADATSRINSNSLDLRLGGEHLPVELKPISRALDGLLDRLESSFNRERQFSADISHELRTPIASLVSLSEVAIRWPDQSSVDGYRDVLGISQGMAGLIESLLLMSRLEEGSLEAKRERINLRQFMEDQCKAATAAIPRAGQLTFRIDIPSSLSLETDPEILGIVVSNLLRNAVDHAPGGSRVEIVSGDGDTVLTFSNDAPDLRPVDMQHLFDRFWRRDSARTGTGNVGLGLSIARSASAAIGFVLDADYSSEQNRILFRLAKNPEKESRA